MSEEDGIEDLSEITEINAQDGNESEDEGSDQFAQSFPQLSLGHPQQRAILRPLRQPLYHERTVDFGANSRYRFFTDRDRGRDRYNISSDSQLGAPNEFDVEALRVTFISRIPECILTDIAGLTNVKLIFGVSAFLDSPVNLGRRVITESSEASDELNSEFLNGGRSFEFDIRSHNGQSRHLLSNERFYVELECQRFFPEVSPINIMVSLHGIYYVGL